jgi:acyl carrier protein
MKWIAMNQDISPDATTVDSLRTWLTDWVAREFGVDRSSIDTGQSFLNYGMDSVQAMTMVGEIESMLDLELPPTLAWDYPDIDSLSSYLAARLASGSPRAAQPAASSATSRAEVESPIAEFKLLANQHVEG